MDIFLNILCYGGMTVTGICAALFVVMAVLGDAEVAGGAFILTLVLGVITIGIIPNAVRFSCDKPDEPVKLLNLTRNKSYVSYQLEGSEYVYTNTEAKWVNHDFKVVKYFHKDFYDNYGFRTKKVAISIEE